MDLSAIMRTHAGQLGWQYTEYDSTQSIVVVPVSGDRFQTVMGKVKHNELYNRKLLTFTSKVCPVKPGINFQMLLEQSAYFNYCRFVIIGGYIQVESAAALDNTSEATIKEMVLEVANLADQYEMKLTGKDVN